MSIVIKPGRVVTLPNGPSASGNSVYRIELDIAPGEVVPVDCSSTGEMNRVESLYVDNSRGATALFVRFADTGRLIIVSPGAEGCYDTYSRQANFLVAQSGVGKLMLRCRLMAFSCRKSVFERFPGAWGLLEAGSDVNNNAGNYSNNIAPVKFVPAPIIAGWRLEALSPAVAFPTPYRVTNAGVSGNIAIKWDSPKSTGKLYFEFTEEFLGADFKSGVGIASSNTAFTDVSLYNNFYVPGPTAVAGVGQMGSGNKIYIGQWDPGGGGYGVGTIVGWAVDLTNKAITVIGNNGYISTPKASGVGNSFGCDISQMPFPICPAVIFADANQAGNATINTTGPFVHPVPAGFTAWDADSSAVTTTTVAPQTQGTATVAGARYWRVLVHSNASDRLVINTLALATTVGGATACTTGVASASSSYQTFAPAMAFDNDINSFWAASSPAPPDQWLQYDFGTPIAIAEVRLTSRNDVNGNNQSPATWELQSSADGVTFVKLQSYTSAPWTTPAQTQSFAVTP